MLSHAAAPAAPPRNRPASIIQTQPGTLREKRQVNLRDGQGPLRSALAFRCEREARWKQSVQRFRRAAALPARKDVCLLPQLVREPSGAAGFPVLRRVQGAQSSLETRVVPERR